MIEVFVHHWEEFEKDWFAVKTGDDADEFFMLVVEHNMVLYSQTETPDWLSFWLPSEHADIVRMECQIVEGKPDMHVNLMNKVAEDRFKQTEKELEETTQENWSRVEAATLDLKNVLKKAETELATMFADQGVKFNTPLSNPGHNPFVEEMPGGKFDAAKILRDRLLRKK